MQIELFFVMKFKSHRVGLQIMLAATFALLSLNLAHAEPGFYRLDKGKAPEAVIHAAQSVFELYQLYGKFSVLEGVPAVRARLKSLDETPDKFNVYRAEQLNFCLEQNLAVCVFVDDEFRLNQATVFVAETEKTIWTSFHVIHDQIMAYYRYCREVQHNGHSICVAQVKSRPLFASILNKDGKVIFKSKGLSRLMIANMPENESLFDIETFGKKKTSYIQVHDAVQLTSSTNLARPIPFAKQTHLAQIGKTAYIVGFPGQTTGRLSRTGHPDSTGEGQYFSDGKILSAFDAESRVRFFEHRPIESSLKSLTDFIDPILIYIWGDGFGGQSGAPILNSDGEVLGIFDESSSLADFSYESSLPYGVSVKMMTMIENHLGQ